MGGMYGTREKLRWWRECGRKALAILLLIRSLLVRWTGSVCLIVCPSVCLGHSIARRSLGIVWSDHSAVRPAPLGSYDRYGVAIK